MLCVRDQIKKLYLTNFILNFTRVSDNLVEIGLLVTDTQDVGENVCPILYNSLSGSAAFGGGKRKIGVPPAAI